MTIVKKPEETVNRVVKRLEKAKNLALKPVADDRQEDHELVAMFKAIEERLRGMNDALPQVRSLEEDLIKRFQELEQKIDDDIDEYHHENSAEILKKLEQIDKKTQSVEKLISSAKLKLRDARRDSERPQVPGTPTSEESSQLIIDEAFLRSEAREFFWRNFNALAYKDQLCLLSLSIFPENSVMKKKPIIYWWIGEGFVAAEEYGESLFQKLINRRLIKAGYGKRSPIADCCSLLPWIRAALIKIARQAELFDIDDHGRPTSGQRHKLLMSDNNQEADHPHNGNGKKAETPFTVLNINRKYLNVTPDFLPRQRKVVVLQLGRWQTSPEHHIEIEKEESLDSLRGLKHLRYLSLRGISRVTSLPRSVTDQLKGLEILDLQACHNLEKLPSDVSSWSSLTHLDVSECYLLESMPSGLGRLSKLQVLKGFIVENTSRASCRISDLAGLRKLRKLSIYIRAKAVVQEQEFKDLDKIASLRNLTISWGAASSPSDLEAGMRSFVLPPGLKKLDLRSLPEDELPKWVDLSKLEFLEKLYIRGGPLKRLRYEEPDEFKIKILRLNYLKDLTVEETCLRKMFPHAIYLEVKDCQGGDITLKN